MSSAERPRWRRLRAAAFCAVSLQIVLVGCRSSDEAGLLAAAQSQLAKQDRKSATIELKTLLQKYPQSSQGRLLLGRTLLESGDAASAVLELQKARELKAADGDVLPPLARALLETGEAKLVTQTLADAKLAEPRAQADLKASLAMAYYTLGLGDRGDAALAEAMRADPKNVEARIIQARRLAGGGRMAEAQAAADQLVAEAPGRAAALILQAELLGANADAERSVAALRKALVAEPANVRAHSLLIQAQQQRRDVAGFRDAVAKLSAAAPLSFEALYYRTELALLDHDLAKATEGVQLLLRAAPEHGPVLHLAGEVELQSGAVELAKKHLAQALIALPASPPPRRLLAEAQLRSGQPQVALATLAPLLNAASPGARTLALAAEAYLQSEDFARAQQLYKRAADADPADPKPRVALALTQVARGNADAGIDELRTIADNDAAGYADMALISTLARRQQNDAALQAIDKLVVKQPDKPMPQLLRGRLLGHLGKPAEARAAFDRALQIDPAFFPAIAELAGLDLAEGRPDAARKRFEAVVAREPRNLEAVLSVIELRRRAGEKPADLTPALQDIVRQFPTEPKARLALIQHHLAQQQPQAALVVAQEALVALPNDVDILDAVGTAQMASGDTQQALSSFRKLITLLPGSPLPFLRLAEMYASTKNLPAAAQYLNNALEVAPTLLPAQAALVRVALAQKNSALAVRTTHDVQKQRPQQAVGYLMEADVQLTQKDLPAALAALRAAHEREPGTTTSNRVYALLVLMNRQAEADRFAADWERRAPRDADFIFARGLVAMEHEQTAAAETLFRRVLAILPDNAAAMNNIAMMMLRQNKPDALSYARTAQQKLPDNAAIMDTLAAALTAAGQPVEALEWQRKAVARDPNAAAYRFSLAKRLLAAGDRVQAKAELEKLAALGGRFDAHDEVSAMLKTL